MEVAPVWPAWLAKRMQQLHNKRRMSQNDSEGRPSHDSESDTSDQDRPRLVEQAAPHQPAMRRPRVSREILSQVRRRQESAVPTSAKDLPATSAEDLPAQAGEAAALGGPSSTTSFLDAEHASSLPLPASTSSGQAALKDCPRSADAADATAGLSADTCPPVSSQPSQAPQGHEPSSNSDGAPSSSDNGHHSRALRYSLQASQNAMHAALEHLGLHRLSLQDDNTAAAPANLVPHSDVPSLHHMDSPRSTTLRLSQPAPEDVRQVHASSAALVLPAEPTSVSATCPPECSGPGLTRRISMGTGIAAAESESVAAPPYCTVPSQHAASQAACFLSGSAPTQSGTLLVPHDSLSTGGWAEVEFTFAIAPAVATAPQVQPSPAATTALDVQPADVGHHAGARQADHDVLPAPATTHLHSWAASADVAPNQLQPPPGTAGRRGGPRSQDAGGMDCGTYATGNFVDGGADEARLAGRWERYGEPHIGRHTAPPPSPPLTNDKPEHFPHGESDDPSRPSSPQPATGYAPEEGHHLHQRLASADPYVGEDWRQQRPSTCEDNEQRHLRLLLRDLQHQADLLLPDHHYQNTRDHLPDSADHHNQHQPHLLLQDQVKQFDPTTHHPDLIAHRDRRRSSSFDVDLYASEKHAALQQRSSHVMQEGAWRAAARHRLGEAAPQQQRRPSADPSPSSSVLHSTSAYTSAEEAHMSATSADMPAQDVAGYDQDTSDLLAATDASVVLLASLRRERDATQRLRQQLHDAEMSHLEATAHAEVRAAGLASEVSRWRTLCRTLQSEHMLTDSFTQLEGQLAVAESEAATLRRDGVALAVRVAELELELKTGGAKAGVAHQKAPLRGVAPPTEHAQHSSLVHHLRSQAQAHADTQQQLAEARHACRRLTLYRRMAEAQLLALPQLQRAAAEATAAAEAAGLRAAAATGRIQRLEMEVDRLTTALTERHDAFDQLEEQAAWLQQQLQPHQQQQPLLLRSASAHGVSHLPSQVQTQHLPSTQPQHHQLHDQQHTFHGSGNGYPIHVPSKPLSHHSAWQQQQRSCNQASSAEMHSAPPWKRQPVGPPWRSVHASPPRTAQTHTSPCEQQHMADFAGPSAAGGLRAPPQSDQHAVSARGAAPSAHAATFETSCSAGGSGGSQVHAATSGAHSVEGGEGSQAHAARDAAGGGTSPGIRQRGQWRAADTSPNMAGRNDFYNSRPTSVHHLHYYEAPRQMHAAVRAKHSQ